MKGELPQLIACFLVQALTLTDTWLGRVLHNFVVKKKIEIFGGPPPPFGPLKILIFLQSTPCPALQVSFKMNAP